MSSTTHHIQQILVLRLDKNPTFFCAHFQQASFLWKNLHPAAAATGTKKAQQFTTSQTDVLLGRLMSARSGSSGSTWAFFQIDIKHETRTGAEFPTAGVNHEHGCTRFIFWTEHVPPSDVMRLLFVVALSLIVLCSKTEVSTPGAISITRVLCSGCVDEAEVSALLQCLNCSPGYCHLSDHQLYHNWVCQDRNGMLDFYWI